MFKFLTIFSLSALPLCAEKIPVYLGTGSDKGIFLVSLDTESGKLSDLKNAAKTRMPASLAISNNQKFLYSVGRERGKKSGFVASFARMSDNTLRPINQQSSQGAGPCHISLDKGAQNLFVANYSGGSVTSYSLRNEMKPGTISRPVSHHQHQGSSVDPRRQTKPHAHSIYPSPGGKFVYSADLGTDKVMIYRLDDKSGVLTPAGSASVPAGGGPRHMAFSSDGRKLFVLNELTLSVSQFSCNLDSGTLTLEKTKPVMTKNQKRMTCSEIQLSADGKYIYAACRDLEGKGRDLMSVLKSDTLEIIQNHPAGVWIPRHFGISPSGKWLLIAGQKANRVIVHARDPETGKLTKTGHSVELESPMWILFPAAMEEKQGSIKLMSYNVRYASGEFDIRRHWKNRLSIMSKVIQEPCIVGFQEVLDSQYQDLKKVMGERFASVGVGRNDGQKSGEHVPIFYRKDRWKQREKGHFWLSDTPSSAGSKSWGNKIPRMCTWVRLLDGETGKILSVFNVHFDHQSANSRLHSATLLLEKVKKHRQQGDSVILMGDMNCLPSSLPMKLLLGDATILKDSFKNKFADGKNSSTFNSWRATKLGSRRIDYILVSPNLSAVNSDILIVDKAGMVASDHNPVIVTVK